MGKGKRYESEQKLNMKKVVAVIVAILVIIMFVVGIKELLKDKDTVKQKTFATGYYAIYENGKWGVIDTKQNTIIAPSYDEMIIIPDNSKPVFIATLNVNYDTGTFETKVLNNQNEEIFTGYNRVEVIYNQDKSNNLWYEKNVLKVQKDEKFGLINLEGKEILPCEYDDIKVIEGSKNIVVTIKDGKQGIANITGTVLVQNEYSRINTITEKYEDGFIVSSDNKFGILSSNGEVVLEPKYDDVKHVYGNKMYVVKEGSSWEIIDTEGNTYLKDEFQDVKEINLNNVIIKKDDKYGVVTTEGETKE